MRLYKSHLYLLSLIVFSGRCRCPNKLTDNKLCTACHIKLVYSSLNKF
uniref:Uncharacterized protein n=1 Tax=Siphoviridae sp. ctvhu9 TaxID=2827968 RepID=A0A8S5SJ51_9CAUD|nr:MAG TPA: hypothetical protein [Siphoviridae sp. ctvhu9]DAZ22483.1 MAG TPA: hypothetical protein [Caudoviricetes sp.]